MYMKRFAATLLTGGGVLLIVAGVGVLAQSNGSSTADTSKEWPTYGHDPGGMRFSPLTEITPKNVSQLKVAWVYHMRPAGAVPPAGRSPVDTPPAGRGAGAPSGRGGGAEGDTPEAVPGGRGRGRGGSGFRPSEVTPL